MQRITQFMFLSCSRDIRTIFQYRDIDRIIAKNRAPIWENTKNLKLFLELNLEF